MVDKLVVPKGEIIQARRRITRAFLMQVGASLIVATYLAYQVNQNHILIQQVKRTDHDGCIRTSILLTKLIKPGLQNLDKFQYYQKHPAERKLARNQINDALKLANPHKCDTLSKKVK